MGIVTIIIIVIILLLAVSVATGYLTKAAADMKVGTDPNQIKAYNILIGASTFGWISVALLLVAGGVYIFYGSETASVTGNTASLIALGFICLVFFINGLLAMFAAIYIKKGVNFSENQGPYTICVWVAVLFLGTTGILLLYELYKIYKSYVQKQNHIKALAIEKQNSQELKELVAKNGK